MFKKSQTHKQTNIFGISTILPANYVKGIEESEGQKFYDLIFTKIREEDFACLYCDDNGRPNSAVNCLVSSVLLHNRNHWSVAELFEHIKYHLLTKTALGLHTFDEMPFNEATYFNFLNRLNHHFVTTGNNLLEQVFDRLTAEQLKQLSIKTNIQRTDSFQAASNIRKLSRLQLLVEMLIRIHRVLDEKDQKQYEELFAPYIRKTSGQFLYHLEQSEIQTELEKIGAVYNQIQQELFPRYKEVEVFKVFERVFEEHFAVIQEKVTIKETSQLTSDCLQSPDDIDATYRKKQNVSHRGQVVNIVETCHPENKVNLITDISVEKNNVDDTEILNKRIETMKEKTPDLEELHHDGGYGSQANDEKLKEHSITPIQTAIRGRESAVEIVIEQREEDSFLVSCPKQTVEAEELVSKSDRYKAEFAESRCASCPLSQRCNLVKCKNGRRYYFSEKDYWRKKRARTIHDIPLKRRGLRANVEATVSEFRRKMNNHKLKVRGYFKTQVFAYATGIGINFGRISRFLKAQSKAQIRFAIASP